MVHNIGPVRALVVATVVGSLALGGCSLINPYPVVPAPSAAERDAVKDVQLAYAIAYAQKYRDAYRGKLSEQAILINSVTPILAVTAAAALGLAAYGAHTDKILGVGLAGGTGYTIATYFSNRPQELTYLAGMEAMSCAVEAVLPLNLSDAARADLKTDMATLNGRISAVNTAILNVGAKKAAANNQSLIQEADGSVTRAQAVVQTASAVYVAGRNLQFTVDGAGGSLLAAVHNISDAVDKSLQQSQPRLESLTAIVAQISSATNIFAPGLNLADTLAGRLAPKSDLELQSTTSDTAGDTELKTALGELQAETAALESMSRSVSAIVNSIGEKRPLEALKRCGVNVGELSKDINVAPMQLSFRAGVAGEQTIIVSGGKSPYIAKFLTAPHEGLTADNPIPGDRSIVVKATTGTAASKYALYVADAAQHEKIVEVVVVGSGNGNNGGSQSEATTDLSALASAILGQTLVIQGLPDGLTGLKVSEATLSDDKKKVRVSLLSVPDGKSVALNDEQKKNLIAKISDMEINGKKIGNTFNELSTTIDIVGNETTVDSAPVGSVETVVPQALVSAASKESTRSRAYGAVASALTTSQVAAIQVALCAAIDGDWGPNTQAALESWRRKAKRGEVGALTTAERDQLLGAVRLTGGSDCATEPAPVRN